MIKVGQKVLVKRVGNAARHYNASELVEEAVVESVGRKYFYLVGYHRCKFDIERRYDVSDFSTNFKVYDTQQEIDDEAEYKKKNEDIRKAFDWTSTAELTLDQIRAIHDILTGDIDE